MSLTDTIPFDKVPLWRKLFLSLVIILVATLSFAVGRLTGKGSDQPIKIEYDTSLTSPNTQSAAVVSSLTTPSGGVVPVPRSFSEVVASKNGEKYHFLHCPGAKQISEKNKITFNSPEAAQASGYTLATNCLPR